MDKSGVSVWLAEGEVNFIIFVGKIVFEVKSIIIFIIVMLTCEIYWSESDVLSSLEPSLYTFLMLFNGEYGNKHALIKKVCLFNQVCNAKSSDPLLIISYSKEEPIVISISIEIVFNQHKVLFFWWLYIEIGPANITSLKIRIYSQIINLMITQQVHLNF